MAALLEGIEVMQSQFFRVDTGTWPDAIDWTAAVMQTHVSATLSTLTSSIDDKMLPCHEYNAWENLLVRYFSQTSAFYFGENAFGLRNQAFDDMLWVVLGWLENIKFMNLHSELHYRASSPNVFGASWHGLQFSPAAAHRARLFWDLASQGWDTSLCRGGMIWNRNLTPYKNAITNELFIAASVSMYLYFPGDDNDSPFSVYDSSPLPTVKPHDPIHLEAAVKAYKWLQNINMTSATGLFVDGYHVHGWHRNPSNGTTHPGTGNCDERNEMVYTYNQGVLLSGQRGLWIATGARSYLRDGHKLVFDTISATGWSGDRNDNVWHGLGRNGILEDYCDAAGDCGQDGHTFKGIFFHHLADFCRPLRPEEEEFMDNFPEHSSYPADLSWHADRCAQYAEWIAHNAVAAYITRDEKGKFGMWWGRSYPDSGEEGSDSHVAPAALPEDAVDYRNAGVSEGKDSPNVGDGKGEDNEQGHRARRDVNDRGRGRTVETQSGGVAALRALWQWESFGNGI